jgi:uncharacterized membrane protein HdeD (DUF308 family)
VSTAAASPTPAVARDDGVGRFWWAPLVAGVLSVVAGIVALAYPEPTLLAVGIIFGAYLAAWGTMLVVHAVSEHGAPTVARALGAIVGLLGLLAGLILLVRPGESVLTVVWVLGFWWTLSGVVQLAQGIGNADGRVWNILMGIVGLAAGIIILAQPGIGLVTLVWIVGIGLILHGALEIAAGLAVRRLHKEGVL